LGLTSQQRCGVIAVQHNPGIDARLGERPRTRKRTVRAQRTPSHAREAEADDQGAAAFQERLAAELLLMQETRHGYLPPFAITEAACLIAVKIRGYVPQRQRWPFIAVRIWSSVGFFVVESRSAAWIIIPFWQ